MSWAQSGQSGYAPRTGNTKVKTRKLGTLEVSELGAGAMSISANYGPPADIAQGIKTLRLPCFRMRRRVLRMGNCDNNQEAAPLLRGHS